ncbi:DoxX family protein [Pseudonocardia asaccharolytica]|uniref:DoxX family protein n=1 Tax=Pseudonocardia asaccharolytica DSM 44247 = NBRC 16224 TaxID=1123024 RepID=A0A511D0M1_9PSEU|nr:DoxX family protein [Pseudonocardia asaccharolytica]GEL17094.1 hypothetical protein PA7_09310 [Pseudonocardia asaccharolytica DSM 44247 = NBRC 16224]
MNLALWVCQALLAAIFLASGSAKISQSKERMLATGQTGVAPFPLPVIRMTALCELLAAFALVIPWATRTAPLLTPIAACGLAVVMIGAAISHSGLREPRNVLVNVGIMVVCVFVAYGRFAF